MVRPARMVCGRVAGGRALFPRHLPSAAGDSPRSLRRLRTAVSTSSYNQTVSNEQFVTRVRDLESKGVMVYDVGSTSAILGEGSAGFEVEELQRYLKEEGFYTSSYGITGYYGPVTKQAVTKWQKANGVLATGNFGGMSRAKYLDLQEGKVGRRGLFGRRRGKAKNQATKPAPAEPARDIKTQTKSFGTRAPAPAPPKPTAPKRAEPRKVVSAPAVPARQPARRQGFKWGSTLIFFVTLVVCWQTLSVYLRQREEREVEKQQMERDRQVQISRWMRTIDTDRRA